MSSLSEQPEMEVMKDAPPKNFVEVAIRDFWHVSPPPSLAYFRRAEPRSNEASNSDALLRQEAIIPRVGEREVIEEQALAVFLLILGSQVVEEFEEVTDG
jgi:hypothetical protein